MAFFIIATNIKQPSFKQQFVSLGDYVGMDKSELGLKEGDIVEILRVGGNGWWFGRHLTTGDEGWVPSTYLEIVPPHHHSSHSSSGMYFFKLIF